MRKFLAALAFVLTLTVPTCSAPAAADEPKVEVEIPGAQKKFETGDEVYVKFYCAKEETLRRLVKSANSKSNEEFTIEIQETIKVGECFALPVRIIGTIVKAIGESFKLEGSPELTVYEVKMGEETVYLIGPVYKN